MNKFVLSCPMLVAQSLLLAMKGEFLMSWGEVNWFGKILQVMCLYMKLSPFGVSLDVFNYKHFSLIFTPQISHQVQEFIILMNAAFSYKKSFFCRYCQANYHTNVYFLITRCRLKVLLLVPFSNNRGNLAPVGWSLLSIRCRGTAARAPRC